MLNIFFSIPVVCFQAIMWWRKTGRLNFLIVYSEKNMVMFSIKVVQLT